MTAPANDNFVDAETIVFSGGSFATGDVENTEATLETFESDDATKFPGDYSIWYKHTFEEDLLVDVDTSQTSAAGQYWARTYIGPELDDLTLFDENDFFNQPFDVGTTIWIRFSGDDIGYMYNLTVTSVPQVMTGDTFDDPMLLMGDENSLELDLSAATLDSGEDVPSGVTKTLWGQWAVPGEDIDSIRFRIASGNATLRLYTWDGTALTLQVADDTGPGDITLTDLDETLDYRLQIGLTDADSDLVTLEWFDGAPSDYNMFAEALEIDGEYGSNILSLQNNDTEASEPLATGVAATGWFKWLAADDYILNFQLVGDPELPYVARVYSGTSIGGLTLVEEAESLAGEDVNFYIVCSNGTQYYLQMGSGSDFMEFEVGWSVEGVEVAPYVDPEMTEAQYEAYWDEGWDQ